jgi:hypothetical protein
MAVYKTYAHPTAGQERLAVGSILLAPSADLFISANKAFSWLTTLYIVHTGEGVGK